MDILRKRRNSLVLVSSILIPIGLSAAPAYAEEPLIADSSFHTTIANAQTFKVSSKAATQQISRDEIVTIAAQQPTTNTLTPNLYAGAQTYNGGDVIAYARQFIGQVPYVANASDPSVGFDCSGFTKYVFGNALGISLPHSSTAQGAMGTPISKDQAQPGDLLIWSGHVAIYTGGNMMIDAAVPGTYISEHAIWGNPTYVRL